MQRQSPSPFPFLQVKNIYSYLPNEKTFQNSRNFFEAQEKLKIAE